MLIKRKRHTMPQLNTTSTADISFMLLTFFLVTTSMDVDRGLVRQLPPLDADDSERTAAAEVSRDNTLDFKITASGEIMMNGSRADMATLRASIARFVGSRPQQHIIYIDTDPAAGYNAYFQLEDAIVAAYNKVRNDMALKKYGKPYAALDETRRRSIADLCPQHISETYNTAAPPAASEKGGER